MLLIKLKSLVPVSYAHDFIIKTAKGYNTIFRKRQLVLSGGQSIELPL